MGQGLGQQGEGSVKVIVDHLPGHAKRGVALTQGSGVPTSVLLWGEMR